MLYVTHDQVEAMTMADRVAVLRDGRVEQVAPPAEVYDRPANTFVARFLGNPPMNVIEGSSRDEGAIGLRPEDVTIVREGGRMSGVVTEVEVTGHDAIVHVEVGADVVLVKLVRSDAPATGDEVGLDFPDAAVHRFQGPGGAAVR